MEYHSPELEVVGMGLRTEVEDWSSNAENGEKENGNYDIMRNMFHHIGPRWPVRIDKLELNRAKPFEFGYYAWIDLSDSCKWFLTETETSTH